MKLISRIAALLTGSLIAATAASAADLATRPYTKAPPMMAAVYDWTGFYIGGEVGGAYARSSGNFLLPPPATFGTNRTMGAGGGFAGYQHQFSSLVIGIEGDVVALFNRSLGNSACNPVVSCAAGFVQTTRVNDPIWSVGGRAGWAAGMWMPYVTGGYAETRITQTFGPGGASVERFAQDRTGYYIGGGIDWALTPNWIVGAEYRHYDFGSRNGTPISTVTGAAVPADAVNINLRADTAMARLSYKFGGPVVAKY